MTQTRPSSDENTDIDPRITDEQTHLDAVYARLDRMRATAKRRLGDTLRESADTPQALSERESYERLYVEDLAKFDAAEHNLYFGRLDLEDDEEVRRIGRIGILDDDAADSTLLLDWRAPLSRPFYLATPAAPDGVARRRHIRTRNRIVRGLSDEVLTAGEAQIDDVGHGDVVNESALVAALNAARTGEMTDIVETIQREQDLIIRSTHRGITVVQGGPGTGKTAVALHRAAYLLYTHREILSRSGVLIIGPNTEFLRYIGQVLPSLGETGVVLSTVGNLFPGIAAQHTDSRDARALKGDLRILDVLKRAVRARQALPKQPVEVHFDGYPLKIDSELVKSARAKARSSRRAHNQAQSVFLRAALDGLAAAHARTIGSSVIDGTQMLTSADLADIRDDLGRDDDIRAAVLEFWPYLTPQRVLTDLFTSLAEIRRATPGWSDADRAALHDPAMQARNAFSDSDVPLIDELAELIGYQTEDASEADKARWRQKLAEAQEALDILTGSAPADIEDDLDRAEILMAYDLIDAEELAARQVETKRMTTAERAFEDRTWTFGHVIVDEAQELSAMAWRMIMRRIPNRWMTIIGDTAQTSDVAGTTSWKAVFEPYVANRWQLHELTVNYRTPAEIMAYATNVLADISTSLRAPTSLRSNGIEPVARRVDATDLIPAAVQIARDADWPGLTAIIVPDALLPDAVSAVDAAISGGAAEIKVHNVVECKGLEFDNIIVVEPTELIDESPRGNSDLYVALTRATQRLVVVHAAELPRALAGMPY
ncbi:AAA family ATPase [Gordonia sp. TBRC 11910]|uniref:AAA family ATPase n=1 Tax=Gordonia asplenii TaxID=2725283 RepID=A0A848L299_9ACTN|nr:AAA family ATPase [Gordonia asplenii]NMO04859.1 AAA family ATPase [Gordonia asplenii]